MNLAKNRTLKNAMALSGKQERKRNIKLYNAIQINKVGEKIVLFLAACHLGIARKFLMVLRISHTFF